MKNRLTVVEAVYYQAADCQPLMPLDSGYTRPAGGDPTVRILTVGPEWVPLAVPADVALVCLENQEGKLFQKNPTDAERAAIAKKVVTVRINGAPAHVVRPACSERWEPVPGVAVDVRCENGPARLRVACYPGEGPA